MRSPQLIAKVQSMVKESPEDFYESPFIHPSCMQRMKMCMELDMFYDIVFLVDNVYIKGNSGILRRRSNYFAAMLSDKNNFKEKDSKKLVMINGIP